jgi:hypothetical protein
MVHTVSGYIAIIYNFVSPLYSNEVNKTGHGQLHTLDSAEATTKRLEINQQLEKL